MPSQQWLIIDTEEWSVRSVPLGREQAAADADPNNLPVAQRSVPTLSISPGGFRLAQRENGDGIIEVNGGSAILWWKGAY